MDTHLKPHGKRKYLCSVVDALKEVEEDFRRLMRKDPFYMNPYLNPKNEGFSRKNYENNRKIVEERAEELEEAGLSAMFHGKTFTVYFDDERYKMHISLYLERRESEKFYELKGAGIVDRKYYEEIYDVFSLLEENPSHGPEHHKDTSAMALTNLDSIDSLDPSIDRKYLSDAMVHGWLLHDIGRGAAQAVPYKKINHARPGKIIYRRLSKQLIKKGLIAKETARMACKIIEKHNMPYDSTQRVNDIGLRIALSAGRVADKRIGTLGTLKVLEFVVENNPLEDLPDIMPLKLEERIRGMEYFLERQEYYPDLSKKIYGKTKEFEMEIMEKFKSIKN